MNMETLTNNPAALVLAKLFAEAEAVDSRLWNEERRPSNAEIGKFAENEGSDAYQTFLEHEKANDYREVYHRLAGHFLNITPSFGKFLYICTRNAHAKRIVEFGTSFGISTIHLACALRDNGGGQLIGTELEASKASQAGKNISTAGLSDLVDIRVGDALETLKIGFDGEVDLVLLDGAFSLYLPVLKILEPHLKVGALIIGENALDPAYLAHVRNEQNGYLSVSLPFEEGRGNEFTLVTKVHEHE
jgi:predicted O-methyltransferase YrrM